jgi:spore germination protein YaaH
MKAYVILRKGFEYDDNIYNSYDGGGGTPDTIVFSKEDAIKKVEELNIEEFKTESITNYSYDIEDVLNVDYETYDNFNKKLVEKYGPIPRKDIWSSNENVLHPNATNEEAIEYDKMINLTFFEYHETNMDMQSFREQRINETLK